MTTALRDPPSKSPAPPAGPASTDDELERLRQLNELKTNLINTAAHELSTPLTPIRLQLHMLKTGVRGPLSNEQKWSVEVVDRNVERLSSLVKDLLDVARIHADRFPIDLQPCELGQLVHEAVDTYRDPAAHAGLQLTSEVEPGIHILADTRRLIQVLFSLLNNAIKFTPSRGSITVRAQRRGNEGVVTVTDTGVGFRPSEESQLFRAFSQLRSPELGITVGAGLGLYIGRSIVDLHGGRIWGTSQGPGKGASFGFALPISATGGDVRAIRTAKPPATLDEGFSRRIRELV